MHGNDRQMRLCIVKPGVVSSIYGDFCEESGGRCTYAHLIGIYKGFFAQVLAYACFYKSEKLTQNRVFVQKSMESFMNETPDLYLVSALLQDLKPLKTFNLINNLNSIRFTVV